MGSLPKKSWKVEGCKGSFFLRGAKNIIWYRQSRNVRYSTKLQYTPKNRLLAGRLVQKNENQGIINHEIKTIGDAFNFYQSATMLKKGDATRNTYKMYLNSVFPDTDKLITNFDYVYSRIDHINHNNFSTVTVSNYLAFILALYNFLIKKKIIANSPISRDDLPKIKAKPVDIYSDTELEKIFNYFKANDFEFYLFLQVLYKTAFRINECKMLKVNQIMTADGLFRDKIILQKSKFGTKPDYFPLSPALKNIFSQIEGLHNLKNDGYLWSFQKLSKRWFENKLNKALKHSNIPKKSTEYDGNGRLFHAFRKTRITKWIKAGISIHGLEKLSRDNYLTIRKYYDAVQTDDYTHFVD